MKRENRKKTDLERKQLSLLRRARELSREIIHTHSEIAVDYRNGSTIQQLADSYFPPTSHSSDTREVYETAIRMALVKLLNEEERKQISHNHIVSAAKKRGIQQHTKGTGMFGRSATAVSASSSRGGKIGGQKSHENNTGVHGLTQEQRIANARIGGTAGAQRLKELGKGILYLTDEQRADARRLLFESRGITPFTGDIQNTEYGPMEEQEYIRYLKENVEVFQKIGGWKGLVEKVNTLFHHNRKLGQIQDCYYKRKKLVNK